VSYGRAPVSNPHARHQRLPDKPRARATFPNLAQSSEAGSGVAQHGGILCAALVVQRFIVSFQPVAVMCAGWNRINGSTLYAATHTSREALGNFGAIADPLGPNVISSWHATHSRSDRVPRLYPLGGHC
jgi:hypothetical protein